MEEKQNFPDKRQHERHPLPAEPEYTINFRAPDEDRLHQAEAINISYGGMMFISDISYECRGKIETVISFSTGEGPAMVLPGTIRWVEKNADRTGNQKNYCVGIQFDKMSELHEIAFRIFIDTFIIKT